MIPEPVMVEFMTQRGVPVAHREFTVGAAHADARDRVTLLLHRVAPLFLAIDDVPMRVHYEGQDCTVVKAKPRSTNSQGHTRMIVEVLVAGATLA